MARRSVLFTPGDRPEMLRKAPGAGADVVVFDLEDAVAPDRKAEAREAVREVLGDPEFDPDAEVCVRLNDAGKVADDDLRVVTAGEASATLDAVMCPKVADGDDVRTLDRLLREHDARVPVFALVESACGVLNAAEIADAAATEAVLFGAEDLAADLGATRTVEGTEVLYARQRVVTAASAAGVDAIDTLVTDFEDEAGLREDAARAVELGYDGKMAIHPAQVGPINDAFTPDPEDVEWAEKVLAAKRAADADDRGVFRVDGEMIDAPLVAQAETILDRARQAAE